MPYCYRCAYGLTYPNCDLKCARRLEDVVRDGDFAALIIEPIQGNGGIITPPPEYFQLIREILNKYKVLLITDEVQTGFGRTGKMFAIEHWDVVPDIMCMGKGIGRTEHPWALLLPMTLFASAYTRPGGFNNRGNPVSATAALATIDVIENYRLVEKAKELGDYFKKRIERFAAKIPHYRRRQRDGPLCWAWSW
ncbi:aminotransferase class III-fold pyridoxal phosphate-dependent enzyme [Candidatus Kuenenia stuttgartensis]|uniref:aminotransferase class III-fold pyridoxal phosphate-dependent enzyme n=1 Tax=Kuenenia stuttgartiensis TaxID=174633 RepID=UPI001B8C3EA5|nr:aminotransferase class III-fold pyridoxal phosphate-dependent enzyme [Candidatus Kuenenia stuttgartiensis]